MKMDSGEHYEDDHDEDDCEECGCCEECEQEFYQKAQDCLFTSAIFLESLTEGTLSFMDSHVDKLEKMVEKAIGIGEGDSEIVVRYTQRNSFMRKMLSAAREMKKHLPPDVQKTVLSLADKKKRKTGGESGMMVSVGGEPKDYSEHPDQWMWCLHCARFFQAKDLEEDECGGKQACPFCGAAGIGIDVYEWDSWVKGNPNSDWSHWPKSESELSKGLHVSMYPKKEKKGSEKVH